MLRWLPLLAVLLLNSCSSEPNASPEIVGVWNLNVATETSTATCTVSRATLTLSSAGPPISGTAEATEVSCTGDGAWPSEYVILGQLVGKDIALSLGLPGSGSYDVVLVGEAGEARMSGTVRSAPGAQRSVTGTWSATR